MNCLKIIEIAIRYTNIENGNQIEVLCMNGRYRALLFLVVLKFGKTKIFMLLPDLSSVSLLTKEFVIPNRKYGSVS